MGGYSTFYFFLDEVVKVSTGSQYARFILFTESLQTCETLRNALGSACAVLEGSMSKPKRLDAVEALRDPRWVADCSLRRGPSLFDETVRP